MSAFHQRITFCLDIHNQSVKVSSLMASWLFSLFDQGTHRSLKTWKVLKFSNLDSRPGRSWNFCRGPWKSWNLDIEIYISIHKHTGIQSLHFFLNMGVSLHVKSTWIHWKGPWIWHWKVLESEMSKCVWTLWWIYFWCMNVWFKSRKFSYFYSGK